MRPNDELLQKIGQVRSKWKAFVWMRGLAWVLGLLVAGLAVGIYLATVTSVPLWVIRTVSLVFLGGMAVAAVWRIWFGLHRWAFRQALTAAGVAAESGAGKARSQAR